MGNHFNICFLLFSSFFLLLFFVFFFSVFFFFFFLFLLFAPTLSQCRWRNQYFPCYFSSKYIFCHWSGTLRQLSTYLSSSFVKGHYIIYSDPAMVPLMAINARQALHLSKWAEAPSPATSVFASKSIAAPVDPSIKLQRNRGEVSQVLYLQLHVERAAEVVDKNVYG